MSVLLALTFFLCALTADIASETSDKNLIFYLSSKQVLTMSEINNVPPHLAHALYRSYFCEGPNYQIKVNERDFPMGCKRDIYSYAYFILNRRIFTAIKRMSFLI